MFGLLPSRWCDPGHAATALAMLRWRWRFVGAFNTATFVMAIAGSATLLTTVA
jgi:hypothetical protein